jgi:hypothetical protein
MRESRLLDNLKIIRIFIGSPGGLDEERQAAHDVVNSVNRSHSEKWGLFFKLYGWENAVPGFTRPQSKINEDLDKCHYFIGILWNKWGSRPSTEVDGCTSGFEEEYLRSKDRIENGLMKDMAIYFKSIEVQEGMTPGEDIQKVFDFKKKCIDEKKVFFKSFSDANDFKNFIREKLEEIGWNETDLFHKDYNNKIEQNKESYERILPKENIAHEEWLFDDEVRYFINNLIQKTRDWEGTSPQEIARFRLIGTALNRQGNDESYLGNHDANLIFHKFRNVTFSKQELRALIDCGVMGFQHQNVPLWRWLSKDEDADGYWGRIKFLSVFGNDTEKKNSINILDLASQPIPSFDETINKKFVLRVWLSEEADSQVFDAAVSFLASNAEYGDLSLIEEFIEDIPLYRRTRVEVSVVGILSRSSLDSALKRLVEKEVDKIDPNLEEILFGSPQSLITETVISCLSAKSDSIRLRAVRVLYTRKEITLKTAEMLLTDSNYEIRLFAAERLKEIGHELSEDIIKKALQIPKSSNNLFGLFGTEADNSYYERYHLNRLAELDFNNLLDKVRGAGIFDDQQIFVLYKKYTSKVLDDIRENLNDLFEGHFDKRINEVKMSGGIDADFENRIRKLEEFQRSRLCANALTVLSDLRDSEDLPLFRKVLRGIEIKLNSQILMYISRFGDWSDISLLNRHKNHIENKTGLSISHKVEFVEQKAKTIIALGKERIADILELDLETPVRISLAKQLPKRVFLNLRDEVLLRELNRKEDGYRVVFALRCVQTLSKSRVTALLDGYVDSEDHRFYNSVHWLDLGAALPNDLAKIIAKKAISQR